MALVQLPVDIAAFTGPADASFCQGQSLLDLLVRASHPAPAPGRVVGRALVPFFGEPAVKYSVSSKKSASKTAQPVNARTRKSRECSSPGRTASSTRAVKARPSASKPPSKVWASCMTSPNPEDVPLPSQAFLLGRTKTAST